MSFWDIIWFIIISFAFIAYLMVLFSILSDLFRDHSTSGGMKAVWIVCLIFFPLVTALVYLIAKGPSMAQRQTRSPPRTCASRQEAYIRSVAGGGGGGSGSPADQISQAKQLLDTGAINEAEFEALKAKALG